MKKTPLKLAGTAVIAVALLAACGGGDSDEAGSLSAFQVTPDEATLTGPTGACPGATVGQDITVVGGTPPYRVTSSLTSISAACAAAGGSCGLTVSSTKLDSQPGEFTLNYGGGCFTATVNVIDAQGRLAIVNVTAEEGD